MPAASVATMVQPPERSGKDPARVYVEWWHERLRREAELAAAWRCRAQRRLPAVVSMLVNELGVSGVVLTGAFVRGDAVPGSAMELHVRGLSEARLEDAARRAEAMLDSVGVRLLCASLPDQWRRAEDEGVRLYPH